MIAEILQEITERFENSRGVVLIGTDGLTVDRLVPPDSSFEQLVVEHVGIIKKIISLMDSMKLGNPVELAIVGDKISVVFHKIADGYFLALGFDPEDSVGRARYELKRAAIPLSRELAT